MSDDMAAMRRWYADNNLPGPPAVCDGLCVTGADIGIPGPGVAYPHPSCLLHSPETAVCPCGSPDRCLSPTHDQIDMPEALEIRHRQSGGSEWGGQG